MSDDFRQFWGIPPKPVHKCGICGTEHKGKCHFMRSRPHRKATSEQILKWLERKRERNLQLKVQYLIKELCDAVETGKRAARPTSWIGRKPNPKSGLDLGADQGKAARDTLTRKPIIED